MVCGCFAPGDVEMLESQLRRQEDMIRDCRSQLNQTRQELQQAHRENDQLQRQLAAIETDSATLLPEQIGALAQAEGLMVDTWRTGLIDQDNQPGVDHLLFVLYPRDDDGDVVKVFGELEVEALDLARPEAEQVLGHWRFTTPQVRDLWHVGFVSTGFHINVPLPQQPLGSELLLHASLRTVDGRMFEVTHTLPVRRRAGQSAPPSLQQPSEFFPIDVSDREDRPAPSMTASRSILVPEPPSEDTFGAQWPTPEGIDNSPEADVIGTERPSISPSFNRHSPTTTSDNWTTDSIPSWR